MNIGIYTLPLNYNYGGLLQAYALQTTLCRMGHKVVIIDRPLYAKEPFYKRPREKFKRIINKYLLRKKHVIVFLENFDAKQYPTISQHTQGFINTYLNSITITDTKLLDEKDFDAIIVGSDQIWRCAFHDSKKKLYDAYLAFAKNWNIKRISYAASFGTGQWEYDGERTIACKQLISRFDAISVREKKGVTLCQKYFNVSAHHVLDPTMLLQVEDYKAIFEKNNQPPSKGNMLVYILDNTAGKEDIVERYESALSLSSFQVNSHADDRTAPVQQRIQPPLEQWLRGFYDAEFVITDSFHACVFSVIFGKPFVVIGNKDRGMERFVSLLNMFGLEDRLISEDSTFVYPQSSISEAQLKLEKLKTESIQFLNKALT